MKLKLLALLSFFFFLTSIGSKTIAQTSISLGIQQINMSNFIGFEYLPSFVTIKRQLNTQFTIEGFYYHLSTRKHFIVDLSRNELSKYDTDALGINLSRNILSFKKLKTSLLLGLNYRLNTIEEIHGHPDYPNSRLTYFRSGGAGYQLGVRQTVVFKNKIELWSTLKYAQYFSGLTQHQIIFDINFGTPIFNK